MQKKFVLVFGLAGAVALMSCGRKKSSSSGETITDAINNALAIGYPDGLSIPTFPQTTTKSSLALTGELNLDETNTKGQTLEQKRSDAKQILEGNVDDCFANMRKRFKIQRPSGENCYQFDQDMIYGARGNSAPQGTKNGKSTKPGSDEVCMVSYARQEMKEIEEIIDQQLDRAQAMACLAKKNGKTLPAAAGDELDLTQDMQGKRPNDPNAPSFTSVKLKRLPDNEGKPVFETRVVSSRGSSSEELTIVHRPSSTTDNVAYNGVISIKRSGEGSDGGKNMLLSIEYARSDEGGAKKIRASVRRARFATSYTEVFDAAGLVNFNTIPENPAGQPNDNIDASSLVEFDVNQADGTGTVSFWRNPGGNFNEAARGFVFKVEKDGDSKVKGCSVSGAARDLSIRKAIKNGTAIKPDGWYHPFFNIENGGSASNADANFNYLRGSDKWAKPAIDGQLATDFVEKQMGAGVSRQCFKQDDSGNYVIDGSANLGTAGYEIIETTNTAKFIAPPDLAAVKGKRFKN
jgi:hypothetical protein